MTEIKDKNILFNSVIKKSVRKCILNYQNVREVFFIHLRTYIRLKFNDFLSVRKSILLRTFI